MITSSYDIGRHAFAVGQDRFWRRQILPPGERKEMLFVATDYHAEREVLAVLSGIAQAQRHRAHSSTEAVHPNGADGLPEIIRRAFSAIAQQENHHG